MFGLFLQWLIKRIIFFSFWRLSDILLRLILYFWVKFYKLLTNILDEPVKEIPDSCAGDKFFYILNIA